jgi:anaerobic magnesium-protoporphyrin IX monomethyl ester cyclase
MSEDKQMMDLAAGTDLLLAVSPANARSPYMPIYFLYLAGYLEEKGFRVEIADPHARDEAQNIAHILQRVRTLQPRFVGLACFVTDYDRVIRIATLIRSVSETTILAGNAHPSIQPEDFLYPGSPFDVVVRGEGELTVQELLAAPSLKADALAQIHGIAYRDGETVRVNPGREMMDLTECAMPAYHKLDMAWYARPTKYLLRRLIGSVAVIYTGRGCPSRCAFCAADSVWRTNSLRGGQPRVRYRSMTAVMTELRLLQDVYGFDFFYVLDDTFGLREQGILDFCSAYRQSGLRMSWAATTRVDRIQRKEVVLALRDAGCLQLDFGVETGVQRLLDVIQKGITVAQIRTAFRLCRETGIRTFANMMINLPGETENDLAATHDLLAEIKPTYVSMSVAQPYPGTPMHDRFLSRPLRREEYSSLGRVDPPEVARMAAHRLDFGDLRRQWRRQYGFSKSLERSLFQADRRYWRLILGSSRGPSYLVYAIKLLLLPVYDPLYYFMTRCLRCCRRIRHGGKSQTDVADLTEIKS